MITAILLTAAVFIPHGGSGSSSHRNYFYMRCEAIGNNNYRCERVAGSDIPKLPEKSDIGPPYCIEQSDENSRFKMYYCPVLRAYKYIDN